MLAAPGRPYAGVDKLIESGPHRLKRAFLEGSRGVHRVARCVRAEVSRSGFVFMVSRFVRPGARAAPRRI